MKKGLSNQEIEAKEKKLKDKYAAKYPDLDFCQMWRKYTKADQKLSHELDFREWVNSCLIYSEYSHLEPKELQESRWGMSSHLELYEVTLERALEIIEEQKERFKEATVTHDTYTDSEGCTYNSCKWVGDK